MDSFQRNQLDFAELLRSGRELANITVQTLRPRNEEDAMLIVQGINNALAGMVTDNTRKGIAILIPPPEYQCKRPDQEGVYGDFLLYADILENVGCNEALDGTGMNCEAVATEVMVLGHHFLLRPNMRLIADKIEPVDISEDWTADIAMRVSFKVMGGFNPVSRCAIPLVSAVGAVTISTSTPGAVCLVTFDGSLPTRNNPAAVPYDGPIALPESGTVVRAAATKDGLEDSGANEVTIP